jgi:hypothetical protein
MATATKAKPKRKPAARRWKSRAVGRRIEPGSAVNCVGCDEHIKFSAKDKSFQVICNVYRKGAWVRVEHFHEACYLEADLPYGKPGD